MNQQESSRRRQVVAAAALIVSNVRHTRYQREPVIIDPERGTYDVDCSGFVSYVLRGVTPKHYARIPRQPTEPCPRAFEYCDYLESLTYDATHGWRRSYAIDDALVFEAAQGWRRVEQLSQVRRGDVIAWRLPRWPAGGDTGHVLLVADEPEREGPALIAVRVYDSSRVPHFEDSREPGGAFESGVGVGTLLFRVGRSGAPTAVQFAPSDRFHSLPIVIGRLEPFTP